MADDRDDLIRSRAYEIWEAEGSPNGRHDQHWAQASQEIGEAQQEGGVGPSAESAEEDALPAVDEAAAPSVHASDLDEAAEAEAASPAEPAKRERKPAASASAAPKGRRKKDA